MNRLLATLLAALGFGIWPMVAKKSTAGPNWTILIISAVTFIGILVLFLFQRGYKESIPQQDIKILVLAGAINVIAWIFYSIIFGGETSNTNFTSYVMILGISIPLFAALASYLILGESISWQKIVGLILGIISICLLGK